MDMILPDLVVAFTMMNYNVLFCLINEIKCLRPVTLMLAVMNYNVLFCLINEIKYLYNNMSPRPLNKFGSVLSSSSSRPTREGPQKAEGRGDARQGATKKKEADIFKPNAKYNQTLTFI